MYRLANLLKWKARSFDLSDENDWLDLLDDFGPSLPRFLLDGSCAPSIPDGDAALNELRQSLVKHPVSSLTPDVGSVWVLFVFDDRLDGLPRPFRRDGVLLPFEWRRDCESHSELLPEALLRLADKVKLQYGDEARDCTLHPSRHFLDAVDFRVDGDEFKFSFDSAWGALATGLHLLLSRKKELKAWPFSTIAYDFENGVPQAVGGLDRKLLLAASAGAEEIAVAPVQYREARKTLAALQAEHPKDKALGRLRIYHWRPSGDLRRSVTALAKCNQPKYRKRFLFCVASLFMFAIPCLMGYAYWLDWKTERISYFKDYVDVYGVPQGVCPLTREQVSRRSESYRMHYQGYDGWCPWKRKPVLRRMFCVNAFDRPVVSTSELPLHVKTAEWRISYKEDGQVDCIAHASPLGIVQSVYKFSGRNREIIDVIRRGHDGRLGTVPSLYALNIVPVSITGNIRAKERDSCSRYELKRNEKGLVKEVVCRNVRGGYAKDDAGVSIRKFVPDEKGRTVREQMYDWNRKPARINGIDEIVRYYDNRDDLTNEVSFCEGKERGRHARVFDTVGNVVELRTTESNSGSTATNVSASCTISMSYDDFGSCTQQLLSVSGECARPDWVKMVAQYTYLPDGGIKSDTRYFDDKDKEKRDSRYVCTSDCYGQIIETQCFDSRTIPIFRYEYDRNGMQRATSYFDANGNPTNRFSLTWQDGNLTNIAMQAREEIDWSESDRGYVKTDKKFVYDPLTSRYMLKSPVTKDCHDMEGRLVSRQFFDENGKATNGEGCGFHEVSFSYDKNGYVERVAYFDCSTNAVLAFGKYTQCFPNEKVASLRFVNDDLGNPIEVVMCGTNGLPMVGSDGFSKIKKTFDNQGRESEVSYFNVHDHHDESVMSRGNNACRIVYKYDGDCKVGQRSFKLDGGYTDFEYDKKGRITSRREFAPAGSARVDKNGIHAITYKYDSKGREIKRSFLNEYKKPVLNEQRYAALETSYDDMGFECETRRLGVNGELIRDINGVCIVRRHYDKMHRDAGRSFYDANTNLVENKEGVAGVRKKYDSKGNLSEEYNVDHKGRPIPNEYGVSISHCEFDQHRRVIKRTFFNGEHQPTLNTEGIAGLTIEYDGNSGRERSRRFFGLDGKPCHIKNGGAGCMMEYDARGNLVKVVGIDTQGKPFADADGIVGSIRKYDKENRLIQTYWIGKDMKLCSKPFDLSPAFTGRVDCCRCEFSQDERQGHTTSILVLSKAYEGVKKVVKTCDRVGNCVDMSFIDDNDNLVAKKNGVARVKREFNVHGDLTTEEWYGADNALLTNGVARLEGTYNRTNSGLSIQFNYYDAQGRSVTSEDGVAWGRMVYDQEYRLLNFEQFDSNGHGTKGTLTRDDKGRVVSFLTFEISEKKQTRMEGVYLDDNTVLFTVYDGENNILGEEKICADDKQLEFLRKVFAMPFKSKFKPKE